MIVSVIASLALLLALVYLVFVLAGEGMVWIARRFNSRQARRVVLVGNRRTYSE